VRELFFAVIAAVTGGVLVEFFRLTRLKRELGRIRRTASHPEETRERHAEPDAAARPRVSRQDVLRHADELRSQGYEVELFDDGLAALAHRKRAGRSTSEVPV
jgi:hypothetical protein